MTNSITDMRRLWILTVLLFFGTSVIEAQTPKQNQLELIRNEYAAAKKLVEKELKSNEVRHHLTIDMNNPLDADGEIDSSQLLDFFFLPKGNTPRNCYFIIEKSTFNCNYTYRELLFDQSSGQLLFIFEHFETDGGMTFEIRYYFDNDGTCIEEKRNVPNEWGTSQEAQERAARYQKVFNLIVNTD